MQKFSSHLAVKSRAVIALLLALFVTFSVIAQEDCPAWPRQLDQAFYCYNQTDRKMKLKHDASIHNPVRFTFPALPSNVTVTFDAGDGNGPSTVSSGEIKTISYPGPGRYDVSTLVQWENGGNSGTHTQKFQVNSNTDINYADFAPDETWEDVTGNTYTPPSNGAYPPGSPWNSPVTAGGIVSILYANPDHRFHKPFILLDGFDPVLEGADHFEVQNLDGTTLGFGGIRWDVLMTGREENNDVDPDEPGVPHTPRLAQFPTLVQGLLNQGYDIVFVDVADGGTYIQANAEFLIKVIERINNHKVGTFPNALIGASMGGFVCRYALSKMESEGKKHCTGLFGTFDTPNNGANVPLGVQAFGWLTHITDTENDIEKQGPWLAAQTPAARQMLIANLGDEIQSGRVSIENFLMGGGANQINFDELTSSDYGVLREEFVSELASFGWPKKPRKIALLDGMKNGTLPGPLDYNGGERIFEARGYSHNNNFGTVFKMSLYASNGGGPIDYTVHGMTNCAKWNYHDVVTGNNLLKWVQPSDFDPCFGNEVPHRYYNVTVKSLTNLLHLDNAPGSFRTDLRTLKHKVEEGLTSQDVEYIEEAYHPLFTFVPTWSSLAMATPLSNPNLFVDLTTAEFEEENLPNAKVPNYDNFYAPATSLRHVELDGGMVNFILTELMRLNNAPQEGVLTETYNYGRNYKEIPNTIVSETGRLNINEVGPTGFVFTNPDLESNKPTFTTYLRDCGNRIDVEAGGEYTIGSIDKMKHGITEVWDGGIVEIHPGGILRITSDNSKLYIKHGATLILDKGAIVILESEGSNILIEGELVVNGDFNFSGRGFFDFSTGNELVYGDGYTTFNLKGTGKDMRFVRLSANLNINNAHRLNWSNGLVEVAGAVNLTTGAGLTFTGMTLQGIGGATAINALNSGAITLESCDVKSLDLAINGEGGEGCIISACNFYNYLDRQVTWVTAPSIQVLNSFFDGESGLNALWLENIFAAILKGSTFEGHGDPLTGTIDDNALMNAGAAVELFDVAACMVIESNFTDNGVGIKSRDDARPSNIYVIRGSTFTNNEAGIYVNGDATRGAVLSDCSLYDNNGTAIRGRDISLMIDSWNTSAWSFDSDVPNRFIRNGWGAGLDKYIRICYLLKAVGGSKLMRNNFWGPVGNPDPDPLASILLQDGTCTINTPAIINPIAVRMTYCGPFERPANFGAVKPGTECTLNTSSNPGKPITVHEQFQLGNFLMQNEDYNGAIVALRPVSALWQANMSSFSENCQQYIKVAKAFVDANDLPGLPRPSGGRSIEENTAKLIVAPNPASNGTVLYLNDENYQIKVWDFKGSLIQQTSASGLYNLDTSAWSQGVYLLEVQGSDGVRKTAKLVIQK